MAPIMVIMHPLAVNAVIEISQGSRAKYEVDKRNWSFKLDRVIYSSFHYPINYGFYSQTLGQDGDPLIFSYSVHKLYNHFVLLKQMLIGNMQMSTRDKVDDKIIAVAAKDPSVNHIKSVKEFPPHYYC
jgi:inorganic pyrophosphatase